VTSEPDDLYNDTETLFRAFHNELGRVAYGVLDNFADAEDARQNSFLRLMKAWPEIAGLPTAGAQRAYLATIVVNEALKIRRRPYRKRERPEIDIPEQGSDPEQIDENLQARENLLQVWRIIGAMPVTRRNVVSLYAAGYEYGEIAVMLNISISTVRSHISIARRQLTRTAARNWEGAQA
jgi:RNA polymerase sigma-70 factor, ECF subfamily